MRDLTRRLGCKVRARVPHEAYACAEILLQRRVPLQYCLFLTRCKEEIPALPKLDVVQAPVCGVFDEAGAEQRHLRDVIRGSRV